MTKLLVGAGYVSGFYLKSFEVINLDASNPALACDNLPDLPLGLEGATGQIYQKSIPTICAGIESLPDS